MVGSNIFKKQVFIRRMKEEGCLLKNHSKSMETYSDRKRRKVAEHQLQTMALDTHRPAFDPEERAKCLQNCRKLGAYLMLLMDALLLRGGYRDNLNCQVKYWLQVDFTNIMNQLDPDNADSFGRPFQGHLYSRWMQDLLAKERDENSGSIAPARTTLQAVALFFQHASLVAGCLKTGRVFDDKFQKHFCMDCLCTMVKVMDMHVDCKGEEEAVRAVHDAYQTWLDTDGDDLDIIMKAEKYQRPMDKAL